MNVLRTIAIVVTLALNGATGVIAASAYARLPQRIATHFGAHGVEYGGRATLWLVPALGVVITIGILLTAFIPVDAMNLTVTVTNENRERVAAIARALIAVTAAIASLEFLTIEALVVASAGGVMPLWMPLIYVPALLLLVVVAAFILVLQRAGGAARPARKS